jgi:glutamine synthetase
MGIIVEYFHHEVSFSQYEIDLRYTDALKMADNIVIAKNIIKKIASKYNLYASFMPKPIQGINGSGMHTHLSLFKGKRNKFFDKNDENYLSKTAKYFIAGILKYAQEISVVLNSTVNSYKRLVPGFEAPVYIAWSRRNRSPLIRIPFYSPGKESATRMEIRNPDPAGNPYLQFASLLGAGLKGIDEKIKLPKPREDNIYRLDELALSNAGIKMLPDSLEKAIDYAKRSKLLKEVLGEHIYRKFLARMQEEWDEYKIEVTKWELERYYPIL